MSRNTLPCPVKKTQNMEKQHSTNSKKIILGNHSVKHHENILVHIFSFVKLNLLVYIDQRPSSLVTESQKRKL